MDDRRSLCRACAFEFRAWEAPAIVSLKLSATTNSSGYNADFKGLHLNKEPFGVAPAPPCDPAAAFSPVAREARARSGPDQRTWEAPAAVSLAVGAIAAK